MPWTVVAIAMGGGADGEGETPPLDLPERLVSPAIILKGSCPAVGAMKKGK
jgi:hypothetical protein